MPKVSFTKHSFSAGELSPQICQSRSDLPIYVHGVSKSHNLIPLKSGSLISRPSNVVYSDCVLPPGACRVIPFNLTQGIYVLIVFGEKTLSIVSLGSSSQWVPREFQGNIDTPYYSWEVKDLKYAVFGSMVVLVHKDHPPHQLIYTGKGYLFSKMEFSPPPWLRDGIIDGKKCKNSMTISDSDGSSKDRFEVKSDGDVFKARDKGRSIRLGCMPKSRQDETEYPENTFVVMGEAVYRSVTGGRSESKSKFELKDKGLYVKDGGVTWIKVASLSEKNSGSSKSLGSSPISQYPVNPYYVWGTIEEVVDARTVVVRQRSKNSFVRSASVVEWFLSAWVAPGEYPSQVTFYQNRLVLSGGNDNLSIHLSAYDDFYSFSLDGEYGCYDPARAISVVVTDNSVSEIKWMHPQGGGVLVGCDSSLWLLTIKLFQGLDVDFRRISGSGVYPCSPVSVGDCLFYVCGAGRRIKSISGSIEQGFRFLDVTQLADHLFKHRIEELVYQEEPHSIIWVMLSPLGSSSSFTPLFGCRFSLDGEGDFAWHTHKLSGGRRLKSIASFPSVEHGETSIWMLIEKRRDSYRVELERLGDFN